MFRHEFDAVARAHMGEKAAGNPGIVAPIIVSSRHQSRHRATEKQLSRRRKTARSRTINLTTRGSPFLCWLSSRFAGGTACQPDRNRLTASWNGR